MGTVIDAAATSAPHRRWGASGALHLSDAAARRCLARGHRRAAELDLIVNIGMYKDQGIAEPALAAIIQEDLGANPGHPPRPGHHGTFSFDVVDGGCGLLTAAYLVHAFTGPGAARLALVVAGDSDPWPRRSRRFPFPPAGGAVMLEHTDEPVGFQRFAFRTFPEHASLFRAATRWDPEAGLVRGKNVLELDEDPRFAEVCAEHALEVVRELLAGATLAPEAIDAVIASQYPRSFAPRVARGLGLPEARLPRVPATLAGAHTAGPIAALEAARAQLPDAKTILFVTCGAGISIAAALYLTGTTTGPA